MHTIVRTCLGLIILIVAAQPLFAQSDPSIEQVYREAHAGHLERAQDMMQQVLRDHPNSAKAHYVMAELYAARGQRGPGAEHLRRAQQLDPGLPFARPAAVQKLERELQQPQARLAFTGEARSTAATWGIAGFVVALAVIIFLLRRRPPPPSGVAPIASPFPPPGSFASPTQPQAPTMDAAPTRSGLGSAVAGGLAAGAGIVAGEALASRLLGTNERPAAEPQIQPPAPADDDLGGDDFGLRDPDSWGDGNTDDDDDDDDDEDDDSIDTGNDDDWQ